MQDRDPIRSEDIYAAVYDEAAFEKLPALLAQAASAKSGLIFWQHRDKAFDVASFSNLAPDLVRRLPEFLPYDLWTPIIARRPGELLRMDRFVSPEAFTRSVMYNELIRPERDDTFHSMGALLPVPWGAGVFAVHRGEKAGPFTVEDEAALASVLNHINQVLRIRGELAASRRETTMARAALDSLALAMITIDAGRRILDVNAAAESLLRCSTSPLTGEKGVLTARSAATAKRLAAAAHRATAPRDPGANWFRAEGDPHDDAYLVSVVPLPAAGPSLALVVFRDADASADSTAERLKSTFQLTTAEAAVAAELFAGRSINEIALMRGVSIETVRWQLKLIAAKMGASRQSEIVALIARLPPV
jgi:DNA-binding CsgD family transcriptional regulator